MALATGAIAQVPDVMIRADFRMHYRAPKGEAPSLRWYDPFGNYSRISLEMRLEPGFRLFVSERLQKINGNADEEQLDAYYLEDPGSWRIGKQYLPFGRQELIRESVIAARAETNLLIGGLPVVGAVFDGGDGRARGAVARVGTRIGVSVMAGEFLGAQSSSLAAVRAVEDGPGRNRGYKLIAGVDFSRRLAKNVTVSGELVSLRQGQTRRDLPREVTDLQFTYEPKRDLNFRLGWACDWGGPLHFYRAQASIPLVRNVFTEPYIRMRGKTLFDAGVTLRVRF